jgi:transposase
LKERGYQGGYSTVKEYLQPKRGAARTSVVRRFETPPGRQAQVDWGHLGTLTVNGEKHRLWGFAFTLGYSRMMMAEAGLDQKLGTLLRMHEEAFRSWAEFRKRSCRGCVRRIGRRPKGKWNRE